MRKITIWWIACFAFISAGYAQSIKKEYEVKKLADNVYAFIWKDPSQNPIEGNALFIINEEDVVVVDACAWPSSAQTMINALKKLTQKPVRYVINTHWHNDHIQGNFLYKKNWPQVEFIAHRNTRQDIIDHAIADQPSDLKGYQEQIDMYKKWLKDGKDNNGKPIDTARRKRVESILAFYKDTYDEFSKVKFVTPDLVFDDSLVIYRQNRIIKVLWPGRANTRGDAVIFLPKERIAATGDLFVYPIPFAFGSYYKDWIKTLGKLDSLEADIFLPGHGFAQYDRNYIRKVKLLLVSLVDEVEKAVKDGLSLEDTQKKITLTEWKSKFAGGDPVKERSFDQFFLYPAVERAWHQAKGNKEGEDQ